MITIIIPVWNAATTLLRCVKSIQAQTYTNWELILSDDGSTDESLAICRDLARKDDRIRVIANQHRGVAYTRNSALDIAKGLYICYVDADDTVDSNYLECLYAHHDADMVISGYWVDVYEENGIFLHQDKYVQPEHFYSFSKKEDMRSLFESGSVHINCNKLLKREIIEQYHLRYKPYPINEDFIFMIEYLLHCNSLFVVEKATYHWIRVKNQQSGVESIPDNLIKIYNEAHGLLRKFFAPSKEIADEIMYYSYNLVEHKYLRALANGVLTSDKLEKLLFDLKTNTMIQDSYRSYQPKSLGEYLGYYLFRFHHYKLYSWIFNR